MVHAGVRGRSLRPRARACTRFGRSARSGHLRLRPGGTDHLPNDASVDLPDCDTDCSTNGSTNGSGHGDTDSGLLHRSDGKSKSDCSTDRLLHGVSDGPADTGTDRSTHCGTDRTTNGNTYGTAHGTPDSGTDHSSHRKPASLNRERLAAACRPSDMFSTRTSMALTAALKRALRGLASSFELTRILHPDSPLRGQPFSPRPSASMSSAQALPSRRPSPP